MIVRTTDEPIPAVIPGEFVGQRNIKVHPGSTLAAKVLVFKHPTALRKFWRESMGIKLERACRGVVTPLWTEIIDTETDKAFFVVDRRFFCVMGLTLGNLSMEIITHESVHAGCAYARRKARSPWDEHILSHDEEAICYPAGRIAAEINRWVHAEGWYE